MAVRKDVGAGRREKVELLCDCGCNTLFKRYRNKVSKVANFLNPAHRGTFIRNEYLRKLCGPFLSLVTEYLEGPARQLYRHTATVRAALCPFFLYLSKHGIVSLQDVTSATVTEFLMWAPSHGYRNAAADTSPLSTFFHWAFVTGLYEAENPVVYRIHGKQKKARLGRPYTELEICKLRQKLADNGNERVRAFFELALASGLRNSELCGLRLCDLSLDDREVKVRLPNKSMRERIAFFDDRAATTLSLWLDVRDTRCEHDFVFHNCFRGPLRANSIISEFHRVLQDASEEAFSVHRLRHTLASRLANHGSGGNAILSLLGWSSTTSAEGYIRLSDDARIDGFATAALKNEQSAEAEIEQMIVLTGDELLRRCGF